jgi:hypothetical protein
MFCSPAQPIKVSCASLLSRAWHVNTASAAAMYAVYTVFLKNIVIEYSHVQKSRSGKRYRVEEKRKKDKYRKEGHQFEHLL